MKNESNIITKDQLQILIDSFHEQIEVICLCIDMIDAIYEIGASRINEKEVSNFFEITRSSLVFRYEIELAKILGKTEKINVKKVCDICKSNAHYFICSEKKLIEICDDIELTLKKNNAINTNLKKRRDQALAHNDSKYYLYKKSYTDEYPLNYDKIKKEVKELYDFSRELQILIGSKDKNIQYPTYPDDVKRLFGMKTNLEIENDNWIKENWSRE